MIILDYLFALNHKSFPRKDKYLYQRLSFRKNSVFASHLFHSPFFIKGLMKEVIEPDNIIAKRSASNFANPYFPGKQKNLLQSHASSFSVCFIVIWEIQGIDCSVINYKNGNGYNHNKLLVSI